MPELPEVETTLRGIYPHIYRQKITSVVVRQQKLRWPLPSQLNSKLRGETVIHISRRGKYLLLGVGTGTLIIHLGMSGSLRLVAKTVTPQKHEHVDIHFGNDIVLRYKDPRRFGAILWTTDNPLQHPLLKTLGLEALSNDFSGDYLWKT